MVQSFERLVQEQRRRSRGGAARRRPAPTSRSKLCTKVTFLFFRTQPAAGSYPQFCLLQPVHAAASLRMLAASAGFPLQNIDAQRQQGRQPWGQPTEGLCTPRRAGSVCRAHLISSTVNRDRGP